MKSTTAPHSNERPAPLFEVAPGVWGMKDIFVNFYMVSNAQNNTWVLIDAGLKTSAKKIKKMAAHLFGEGAQPTAIILTHAHFDHVGALEQLVYEWKVPVYAHFMEMPYLTCKSSYPPPDPWVGGGIMPLLSVTFPRGPINLWSYINVLDDNGSLPGLPGWKYLHTPGHAPGHISLYREEDSVLIAGDAFVTTNQQSAIAIMRQTEILTGPPKYFTYDWEQAKESVRLLMELNPLVVATGHGKPMQGYEMQNALKDLYENFEEEAMPLKGRYVDDPAVADANGFLYIPPSPINAKAVSLKLLAIAAIAASILLIASKKKNRDIKPAFYKALV